MYCQVWPTDNKERREGSQKKKKGKLEEAKQSSLLKTISTSCHLINYAWGGISDWLKLCQSPQLIKSFLNGAAGCVQNSGARQKTIAFPQVESRKREKKAELWNDKLKIHKIGRRQTNEDNVQEGNRGRRMGRSRGAEECEMMKGQKQKIVSSFIYRHPFSLWLKVDYET